MHIVNLDLTMALKVYNLSAKEPRGNDIDKESQEWREAWHWQSPATHPGSEIQSHMPCG